MSSAVPEVVLTREQGKNDSVAAELARRGVHVLELPLIEATAGPDRCSIYADRLQMSPREELCPS